MDKSNVNDTEKWLPQAENTPSTPDNMGLTTTQTHATATQTTDERYMRRCLQLARCGLLGAKPNPMVGAVVVHNDRIIGEGYHIHYGEGHAEVNAFAAIRPEDEPFLPHSTLYVSLEPCSHYGKTPPCADLIIRKGVARVVVGCVDPFSKVQGRGIEKLRQAGIEVVVGVLEKECLAVNRRFIVFQREQRPYVIMKWAQTANGFIDDHFHALAISTPFTQMLSHKLRAECDAILVGKTTDEREHPALNTRHWWGENPRRLVLHRHQPITQLLAQLYQDNVQTLIVEGGAIVHQAFIDANCCDEIHRETAPFTVFDGTRAVAIPPKFQLIKQETYDGNVLEEFVSEYASL